MMVCSYELLQHYIKQQILNITVTIQTKYGMKHSRVEELYVHAHTCDTSGSVRGVSNNSFPIRNESQGSDKMVMSKSVYPGS